MANRGERERQAREHPRPGIGNPLIRSVDYDTWIRSHPELVDESEDFKRSQYQVYLESLTDLHVESM